MTATPTPTRSSAAPATRFALLALALVVALSGLGTALAQGDETHGAFHVVYSLDGFTDANRSYIMAVPTDFRSGYSEDNLGFASKCLSDGLNVIVTWGKFFGGDRNDQVTVRYRFDDRPSPAPGGWEMFPSSEMAWMPMHLVDEFVATARSSRTLLLSVTDPLDGETIVNTFSLDGYGTALDRILPCD